MARIARIVIPDHPHLVTQRGNRGEPVFFEQADYEIYTDLVFSAAAKAGCEIWAYCWMPNHTHTILVPRDGDGLRKTFADAHRRYTRHVNARLGVTGHLWQGRFGSVVMDESTLIEAVRYVSLNPVRAKLVKDQKSWPWSSTNKHLNKQDDRAFHASPVLERIPDFENLLASPSNDKKVFDALRSSETTGRPVGERDWITSLEEQTGRSILPAKRGPKPRSARSGKSACEGKRPKSNIPSKNQWSVW